MGEQESVPEPTNQKSIFRFGLYELDGGTGELRKDGKPRPRLQGQPLEVLLHLSRPSRRSGDAGRIAAAALARGHVRRLRPQPQYSGQQTARRAERFR